MAAQPNWYPDPADPENSLRYWDGSAWSNETRPRPQVSPATPQPSAPQYANPVSAPQQQSAPVNPFAVGTTQQSAPQAASQPSYAPSVPATSAPAYTPPSSTVSPPSSGYSPATSNEDDEVEGTPLVQASPLSALLDESRADRSFDAHDLAAEDAPTHHPAVGAFRDSPAHPMSEVSETPVLAGYDDAQPDDDDDDESDSASPVGDVDPNFPYTVKEIKKLRRQKAINDKQYKELLRRADKRASNTRFFSAGGGAFALYVLAYLPVLAFVTLGATGFLVDPTRELSFDAIIASLANVETFVSIVAAYAPFWWATVALITATSLIPGLLALFSLRKHKGRVWSVVTLVLVIVANPVVVVFGAATNGLLTVFGWI